MPPLTLPHTFATAGLRTPAAWLDANFDAVATYLNTYGATLGTIATRPAPTAVGQIYVATDQGGLWYLATGTAWIPVGRMGKGAVDLVPDTDVVRFFGATPGDGAAQVITCAKATGTPGAAAACAQLFVKDVMGVDGDAAWHQRTEDGWLAPLDRTVYRSVGNPAASVANTTTETRLVIMTLEGRAIGLGGRTGQEPRGLEVALALDVFNNSGVGGRTITLRLKYGGQTGATTVLTLQNAAARKEGGLTYRLDPTGATTQVVSPVRVQFDVAPTSVTHTLPALTVDPTADQSVELTAQCSVASANVAVRVFSGLVGLE